MYSHSHDAADRGTDLDSRMGLALRLGLTRLVFMVASVSPEYGIVLSCVIDFARMSAAKRRTGRAPGAHAFQ